ncbi:hypothetical protein J2X12_002892 [Pseudarthrobacter oxydans]|uniref:Uncharacterized protein n=1 Tax=Pseudarthrobacter oxydans TaxID=1671 RepID=A0AAW8NE43_PSEOX|nr:hypothetical protein [Pseudarthrobacter oxydans]MDR6794371.1 hypothetical protein [Pseudarthrobacter oxydans]MDR7164854.1 hypothetical protein [Pseudarthrobacter oxydans]
MTAITVPVFGSANKLVLKIMREFFVGQDIHIGSLFTEDMPTPAIICRAERRSGTVGHDPADGRYLKPVIISINTITSGLEAESDGHDLQEMCRVALIEAQLKQAAYTNLGHISNIENSTVASKVSDWATSTGVVQYAALPKGAVRYESIFRLIIRPPTSGGVNNRFRPLR